MATRFVNLSAAGNNISRFQSSRSTSVFLLLKRQLRSRSLDSTDILPPFSQRLTEWYSKRPVLPSTGVNIGFHYDLNERKQAMMDKFKNWRKNRLTLEKAARHRELKIDLQSAKLEFYDEAQPFHVKRIAEHYGIFNDLFDGAHFYPVVPMHISYDYDEEFCTPVCSGNIVPASEAAVSPYVNYEAMDDSLWTLVMTSPDGNLQDPSKELLHWFVGNIRGSDLASGETLCDYLPPFPMRGVGFLRYVFVLYKQVNELNLSNYKQINSRSLSERTFSTYKFYKENEESLTPTSLAFFQSEWDHSIKSVFHDILEMPEPAFEFLHPPRYLPEEENFPELDIFHEYLDKYRDSKDIQEELFKEKLRSIDPAKKPSPPPKWPNLHLPSKDEIPSWLRAKIKKMNLKESQNVEKSS